MAPPPDPDEQFHCRRLDCQLRGRVCVRRQLEVERALRGDLGRRSSRRKRGLGVEFPACHRCPQGIRIRARLGDDACAVGVRHGERPDHAAYAAWRARNQVSGEPMILDHLR